ncbi:MAG: HPr family phosphocarrier protein [Acidobacteria bacterium]|nr:HPr family phosphocarrier protein [Acidobacteriota bacterium]
MTEKEIVISNRLGLHARAAAKFVQAASRFRARINLSRDGQNVDGKSILGILMLAAAQGSRLMLRADGPDESEAVGALAALVDGKFGEGQ